MFNPTNPSKNKDNIYEYLGLDNARIGVIHQLTEEHAQDLQYLSTLNELKDKGTEGINDAGMDVAELDKAIELTTNNISKKKAVIDHLQTAQARDIIKDITYEEFMQVCGSNQEDDFNLAESIYRLTKVGDNAVKRFSELFKEI